MTLTDLSRMVRPWYRGIDKNSLNPGSVGDHLFADCEVLTEEGTPREGIGWMNPYDLNVCLECLRRYDRDEWWKRVSHDEY